jgi:hypothetical protein
MYRLLLILVPLLTALPMCAAERSSSEQDVADLAALIDKLLAQRWTAASAVPAASADDAEFLRRAHLDLTGKIPSVAAAREFLEDTRADKRRRLVERLLRSSGYVTHFTDFWRAALLPDKDVQGIGLRLSFETWLRGRLRDNVGYDKMVREILTVSQPVNGQREIQLDLARVGQVTGPIAFYQANENKPENLAGSTGRLFLGVRIECAQCHDHPFARWSRDQFWQYAAFFGPMGPGGKPRALAIPNPKPGGSKQAEAHFLDGGEPKWKAGTDPRGLLADWMLSPENPYFARATVNRIWAYFFGTGLIEPIDDLTQNVERNELLDELARSFVEHNFDLKYLIQGIVTSRAYGLSSRQSHPSQIDPKLFARMQVRGLAPEQIFDNLLEATRHDDSVGAARAEFLVRFANATERPIDVQTSILQALAMMNGKLITDATSLHGSATLKAVIDSPFLDSAGRIEALCLAALSRKPRADESARLVKYVDRGGPSGDGKQALADVFWALLNSSEFLFNH